MLLYFAAVLPSDPYEGKAYPPRLGVKRLVIAGGTAGVLDESGKTLPDLDEKDIERLIASGVASAGMVAKLGACRDALAGGVDDVLLVDGKDAVVLRSVIGGELALGLEATRLRARSAHILAGDLQKSAARRQQAAQHAECRRLACTVGAEQAEDLAASHREGGVVDGNEVAELSDQIPDFDHDLI